MRRESSRPLVEIAEHDARRRSARMIAEHFKQPACLITALEESGAEMHVVDLQQAVGRRLPLFTSNHDLQAAARFVPAPSEVVIEISDKW